MAKLNAAKRHKMPKSEFALPGERFPINDKNHARLAIGGATRAERAGNISPSQAAAVKSKAMAKLRGSSGASGMGHAQADLMAARKRAGR